MSSVVNVPFAVFFDVNGMPLDGGTVYIGVAGLNPLSNPQQAYYDEELTKPIGTMITRNGYVLYNGAPTNIYVPGDCSILVKNKAGKIVFLALNNNIIPGAGSLITSPRSSFQRAMRTPTSYNFNNIIDTGYYAWTNAGTTNQPAGLAAGDLYALSVQSAPDGTGFVLQQVKDLSSLNPDNIYHRHSLDGGITWSTWLDATACTIISTDTTLVGGGKYLVTLFVNITLPVSAPLGTEIKITAPNGCRILQTNVENIIVVPAYGLSTVKGATGNIRLSNQQEITLIYIGSGTYVSRAYSLIGSLTGAVANGQSVAWSPDGNYLAVGTSTTSPYVQWYKRAGDTMTLIGGLSGAAANGRAVAWSPDGNYLAAATFNVSPYVQWYKRTGDTMALIGGLPGAINGRAVAWSPDGNYLAVGTSTISPYVQWYKRAGDTMTLIGGLSGAAANGYNLAWSPDGNYLAITTEYTSPYAQWYKRTGDTMTLIGSLPSVAANGYSLAWSPDGNYLAIATYTISPYIQIYKRTGDTMTLLGGLTGVTAYGHAVAWSPDGNYLATTSSTISPYVQWYRFYQTANNRYLLQLNNVNSLPFILGLEARR